MQNNNILQYRWLKIKGIKVCEWHVGPPLAPRTITCLLKFSHEFIHNLTFWQLFIVFCLRGYLYSPSLDSIQWLHSTTMLYVLLLLSIAAINKKRHIQSSHIPSDAIEISWLTVLSSVCVCRLWPLCKRAGFQDFFWIQHFRQRFFILAHPVSGLLICAGRTNPTCLMRKSPRSDTDRDEN